MEGTRLVAVTSLDALPEAELLGRAETLARLSAPGTLGLLLRDHQASAALRLKLGHELRSLTARHGQSLWVADRLDVALLVAADVLHLGEQSVRPSDARRLLPASVRLSRAWHHVDAAPLEELAGVDALILSPVVAPRKGRKALGLGSLRHLRGQLATASLAPAIFALGGVDAAHAGQCLAAGATGVAVMGAAWSGELASLLGSLGILRE